MAIHDDTWLILLSALASSLAMFATFGFVNRLYLSTVQTKKILLPIYALTVGSGLWSIHFINWLAFHHAATLDFSIPTMFGAYLAAVLVGFITCYVASKKTVALSIFTVCGLVAGLSSYAMFYLCASALYGASNISVIPMALFSALLTSICISFLALITLSWMKQYDGKNPLSIKILFSFLTSIAIIGLHITFNASIVTDTNSIFVASKPLINKNMLVTLILLMVACLFLLVFAIANLYEKFGNNMFKLNFISPNRDSSVIESKDALTQLPNRRAFRQLLEASSVRYTRAGNTIALAYIDLDHFKPINDQYGHHVGDAVLKIVAQRLQTAVRGCDSVARLGGDEFAALIEDIESDNDIVPIIERIVNSISQPLYVNNQQLEISCSVGVALYPRDGDIEKLMICADSAMYKAKANGRNQFKFYDTELASASNHMQIMQADLLTAIAKNQFSLLFHPKIDCKTQLFVGAEALIRWNHPTKGIILPKELIPVAEHLGLIDQINDWVIKEACRAIGRAKSKGIDLNVSINLSKQAFRNKHLVNQAIGYLKQFGASAENLTIEIKETSGVRDEALFNQLIAQFRAVNIRIALDDFGLHPFTLNYLQDLNVDEIKIDKIFVSRLTTNPESWKLVDVLINLAHTLNINVVAEGIENETQSSVLAQLGCNHMQGYLFSVPIVESDLYHFYNQRQLSFS
jgi:diguanylate cyclase (GGDEF)-like protein